MSPETTAPISLLEGSPVPEVDVGGSCWRLTSGSGRCLGERSGTYPEGPACFACARSRSSSTRFPQVCRGTSMPDPATFVGAQDAAEQGQ
jgi:hypothetical protein